MSPLQRLLRALTPQSLGVGPSLVLYALLASAIVSVALLNWASRHFADVGPRFAWYVGANCLGFVAFSFWVAVRQRRGVRAARRALLWAESIPLALALILSLAYASVAGSVYSSVEPAYGKAYIFHSYWYLGLIVMLAVNLVLCSYEKSAQVFLLPGRRDVRDSVAFFRNARTRAELTFAGTPEEAARRFRAVYPRAHVEGAGAYVQRGLFSRFGPTVVHIGLMIAFAAGGYRIMSERIGLHYINSVAEGEAIPSAQIRWMGLFDSQIQIEEGTTTRRIMVKRDRMTPFSRVNSREVILDFDVKCHNFEADMYPGTQTPRYFASLLEITDRTTGDRKIATVDMNTAVAFQGYKFSQNSYSALPDVPRADVEVIHVASGERFVVDVGPDTRNKLANKGPAAHFQLWVGGFSPGDPWHLYDERRSIDEPVARGALVTGEALYSLRPIAFYRDFRIDDPQAGPIDVSDELRNPCLVAILEQKGEPPRPVFLFMRPGMPVMGAPEELDIRLVDVREATGPAATAFEKTGDVPPLPRLGTFAATASAADAPDAAPAMESRFEQLRRERYPVSTQYEFRVVVAARATGRTFAEGWLPVDRPLVLPVEALAAASSSAMGSATGPADAAPGGATNPVSALVEEARRRGDAYVVRYLAPTQGYRTILGVIRDPSLPYLYFGCLVVIFGVLQAFAMTYREVWMHVEPPAEPGAPSTVHLAMKVRGSGQTPFEEFARVQRALVDAPSAPSS